MLARSIVLLALFALNRVFGAAVYSPSTEYGHQACDLESNSCEQFIKSDQDKNEYRLLTLSNQLQALIISAPTCENVRDKACVQISLFCSYTPL